MNLPDLQPDLGAALWRTSSHSGSGDQCVEVAALADRLHAVRDSKDPHGPVLVFDSAEWRSFLDALRHF
jgi:Domain of unknown function (DUF397)